MAHKIDNSKGFNAFVSYDKPAWHGLGTTLKNPVNTQDALMQGGLDYMVLKMPNVHFIPNGDGFIEVVSEDSFFTYRSDVNKVLGSRLGKDYTVMQNLEALNIVDEILNSGTATIETAGAIDEGKKVFICLKVNQDIIVGSSDTVKQYVLIANSHDGSLAITAMPTNIRVVCNNTLSAALGEKSKDKIKIRHTINADTRLNEAMKIIKLLSENTHKNEDNYNKMAETIISKEQMFNYFGNVFCTPEEIKELQKGNQKIISTRKANILDEVRQFANNGIGQSLAMKGNNFTMWSAYNAVTGYVTRKNYASVNDRANSMLFGSAADTIETAGALALNPSKIQTLSKIDFSGLNLN